MWVAGKWTLFIAFSSCFLRLLQLNFKSPQCVHWVLSFTALSFAHTHGNA